MKDNDKFVFVWQQIIGQVVGRIVKQTITPYGTALLVRVVCYCGHPECTGVKDQILLPAKMAFMPSEERAKLDASLAKEWNLSPEDRVSEPVEVGSSVVVMD